MCNFNRKLDGLAVGTKTFFFIRQDYLTEMYFGFDSNVDTEGESVGKLSPGFSLMLLGIPAAACRLAPIFSPLHFHGSCFDLLYNGRM